MPLIVAGLADEHASGSPLSDFMDEDPTFLQVWKVACDQYFLTMDQDVLIEAIAGNIDLAYRQSKAADTKLT